MTIGHYNMDGTGIFTGKIMGIITNNYNGIYCIMINYIIGCLEYGGGVEKGICEPKSAGVLAGLTDLLEILCVG